jgi:hypothetical protein
MRALRKTQITTENQPEFPSLVSFESWLKHFADSSKWMAHSMRFTTSSVIKRALTKSDSAY